MTELHTYQLTCYLGGESVQAGPFPTPQAAARSAGWTTEEGVNSSGETVPLAYCPRHMTAEMTAAAATPNGGQGFDYKVAHPHP